jgi:hypothetical protein
MLKTIWNRSGHGFWVCSISQNKFEISQTVSTSNSTTIDQQQNYLYFNSDYYTSIQSQCDYSEN